MNVLKNKNKSLFELEEGTPMVRYNQMEFVRAYNAGDTISEDDFQLRYPNENYQPIVFSTDTALVRIIDIVNGNKVVTYRLYAASVIENDITTAADYSGEAVQDLFNFQWSDSDVKEVTKTELVNMVSQHTGPLALVWRKKAKYNQKAFDSIMEKCADALNTMYQKNYKQLTAKELAKMIQVDVEDQRDMVLGEMDHMVGQRPDTITTALSTIASGRSATDQLHDDSRSTSGYLHFVDYREPFTGSGNLRQVRMDGLLAFINPQTQEVFIVKTSSGTVTRATQKRIINTLRQGIASL